MTRVSTITRCATTGSACGPLTDDSELTASWPGHNVTTASGFKFSDTRRLQRCTAPLGRTSEISEVRIISRPSILAQEQKGYRDASVLSRGGPQAGWGGSVEADSTRAQRPRSTRNE